MQVTLCHPGGIAAGGNPFGRPGTYESCMPGPRAIPSEGQDATGGPAASGGPGPGMGVMPNDTSHPVAPATPQLGHYEIDPGSSRISFRTRHMFGLAPVRGTFAIRSGIVD